jgi:putative acyl-CoA dehydrogenase
VAALAEAGSPFAAVYADSRLGNTRFAQYGAADLGSAETSLIDRALAA